MNRKIAVLRGINVGGKRKILMADLKSMCENLGLENVKTYIQSGNLLFTSNTANSELESKLEKAITENFGFDVPVIVRAEQELKTVIDSNPFVDTNKDIAQLHLTFLKEKPAKENVAKIASYGCEPDKFSMNDKEVYIFCAGKYHKSKLTNNIFEKRLKVGATTRNWKTVLKLLKSSLHQTFLN